MRFPSLAITTLSIAIAVLSPSVASGQWAPSGSDIFFNGGKVGIGTSTPTQKLTVGGGAEIADVPPGGTELSTNGVDWTGSSSIGTGWATSYWNGMGGSVTFTTSVLSGSPYGFSGNYQRVVYTTVTGTTIGKLYQALTFQQNHLYRITFKYRSSSTLQVTLGDNEGGGILGPNTGAAIPVTMITGPTIQNRPSLDFYLPGGGLTPTSGSWFEIDDVSVKEATFGGDLYVHGNMTVGSVDTTGGLLTIRKDQTVTTAAAVRNYNGQGIARVSAQSASGSLSLEQIGATNGGSGARYNDGGVVYGSGAGGVGLAAAAPGAALRFYTGGDLATNERMRIDASGNVGIGTTAPPTATLEVNGTIKATSVIGAVYQDVAEWVPATTHMEPGTVVVLNRSHDNEVMPSTHAYDTAVAGVVSANPGLVLGVESDSKAQVATTGRVKVRVDATKGAIAIGDLLVTGDKPGTAIKSQPIDVGGVAIHRPGTVIGKALQPLPAGEGEILVLLSLQ